MEMILKKKEACLLKLRSHHQYMDDQFIITNIAERNEGVLGKIDLKKCQVIWEIPDAIIHMLDDCSSFWHNNADKMLVTLYSYLDASIVTRIDLDSEQGLIGYHGNHPVIKRQKNVDNIYQCFDGNGVMQWEQNSSLNILGVSESMMFWSTYKEQESRNIAGFCKISPADLSKQWCANVNDIYHEQFSTNILTANSKILYYYTSQRIFKNHFLIDVGYREKFGDCTYLSSINVNTGELEWFSEERDVLNFKVIEDDIILCRNGEIVIIDLHTGITKKKGPIQTNGMQLDTRECNRFTIKDGLMYVCFNNFAGMRSIGVVEMENFNVLWYEDVEGPGVYRRYTLFAPMIVDNDIYVIDSEHNLLSWERTH